MSIPPTKPSSGSSRSSEDPDKVDDKGAPKKEFKLPKKKEDSDESDSKPEEVKTKKEQLKSKKEESKEAGKGVFELSAMKAGESFKQPGTEEVAGTSAMTPAQGKAAVSKIYSLIQSMASQLQVGTVGGKDFASLELKTTPNVPTAFQGAQLTLQQTSDGLVIRFDNLQNQASAIQAVEQNKEQLANMMLNLQSKNIQVAELHLGGHKVTLPELPQAAPIQASPQSGESTLEREGHGQRGDEGEQQGEQGPSE